jgi:glycosyltransferase involved in cell wall biosynthesis
MPHALKNALRRNVTRAKDRLRYSPVSQEALARALASRASLPGLQEADRVKFLLEAFRISWYPPFLKQLRHKLAPWLDDPVPGFWEQHRIGWERYPTVEKEPGVTRTVLLKAPGPASGDTPENRERGLILSLFEYNWLRILRGIPDFRDFETRYNLIFGTSWSPTHYALLGYALSKMRGTVYIQPCNIKEIQKLELFHPRVRCLRQLGCEWISPANYRPKPIADRQVDLLKLANFAPFKRHFHFFRVLSQMSPDLRVTLIGQKEAGRTQDDILREARLFGAPQKITIHESIPPEQVAEIQANSRVATIFSMREGQCIAMVEALFAGASIAMLQGAHLAPTAYVNDRTGTLLQPGREARQLQQLIQNAGQYDPAAWARENISANLSNPRLNAAFRQFEEDAGRPWITDLQPFCYSPYPTLRHNPNRAQLQPAVDRLHQQYPRLFPGDLLETSHR